MISRRAAFLAVVVLASTFAIFLNADLITKAYSKSRLAIPIENGRPLLPIPKIVNPSGDAVAGDNGASPLSPHVLGYFNQVFSADKPAPYDFPALRQTCEQTRWQEDDVYLKCVGMAAGMTTIMSQVKVCLKMAFEAGTGIVLPAMPLRNSTNLQEFNFLNPDAYMPYNEWFDANHLIEQTTRICPRMKIVHPDQLDSAEVPVKHQWEVSMTDAPGFQPFSSYFWAGRPFRAFFDQEYAKLKQLDTLNPDKDESATGINVVTIISSFLLFRIMDDPTGNDRKLWNDLSHLVRFTTPTRELVSKLLSHVSRPFYGVHFRVESDTIWSSLEHQLGVDLDALDRAWVKYGTPGAEKPLVYLACGDQEQVNKFVEAGKERGWEVTHKWQLAQSDPDALARINELPFDFQGAVDMGFMVRSHFFLGITGSAFSSTVGNARDVTGRYRGSSFDVYDDENARTHLFNDGDASHYACCL